MASSSMIQASALGLPQEAVNLDSVRRTIDSLDHVLRDRHVVLLERINEQVSLGWTPYSVSFTILTTLIAIMAIVAGVMFFLQGQDFRNRLQGSLAAHDAELKRTVATYDLVLRQELERFANEGRANVESIKIELADAHRDRPEQEGAAQEVAQARITALEQRLVEATAKTRAAEERASMQSSVYGAGARLPQPHELAFLKEHPEVVQSAKPAHRRGMNGDLMYSAICKGCDRQFILFAGFAPDASAYYQPCTFCGTSNLLSGAKATNWSVEDSAHLSTRTPPVTK